MHMLLLDESEQKKFLGIGGYYAEISHLAAFEARWHDLKNKFGLDLDDEIKWNLPSDHNTRKKLIKIGLKTKELSEAAVDLISSFDLTIVAVIMLDLRKEWWDKILKSRIARDFYCEGLKYLLQRFAEQMSRLPVNERLAFVTADRPSLRKLKSTSSTMGLSGGEKAPLALYRKVMTDGPGEGPQRKGNKPLRELGFHSGLLISHADHNDLIQIADVIIGCVTSWVADTGSGKCDSWLTDRVKKLEDKFRGHPLNMFGDGIVMWPMQPELWSELKISLR